MTITELDFEDAYERMAAYFADKDEVFVTHIKVKLGVGYNKACDIVEAMEDRGFCTTPDGLGRRLVLA